MSKFTYNDEVIICEGGDPSSRVGEKAWVVGICEDARRGEYHKKFPPGTVYTIEFLDGSEVDVVEADLEYVH